MKKPFLKVFMAVIFILSAGFFIGSRQAGVEIVKDGSVDVIVSISGNGRLYIGENVKVIYDNVFCNSEGKEALVTEIEAP